MWDQAERSQDYEHRSNRGRDAEPGKRSRTENLPPPRPQAAKPAPQPAPEEHYATGLALEDAEDPFGMHLLGDGPGEEPEGPRPITKPPQGLRYRDGMTAETKHLKPFVRKMQRQLGEKMNAELVLNGEFDDETLSLLHLFQANFLLGRSDEIDEETARLLTDGNGGAGPSQFPEMNPELEDLMTLIWSNHMVTMRHCNNALNQLAVDLAKPVPHKESLAKHVLELGAVAALSMFPKLAEVAIAEAFKLHPKDPSTEKVVGAAIEAPFDALIHGAEKHVESAFHHWQAPRAPEIAAPDFIEAQRRTMTINTTTAEQEFLGKAKPEMRKQGAASAAGQDPRIEPAKTALTAAQKAAEKAEKKQYVSTMSEWSTALARTDLKDFNPNNAAQGVNMADQHKVDHARGVMELRGRTHAEEPWAPVQMYQSFVMRGVPHDAAAHLRGCTIGELSMPIHAEITVYDSRGPFVIDLGKSGRTCWHGADKSRDRDRVRHFLAAKAGGPGAVVTDALVEEGARLILLDEIKNVVIDFVKIEG